MKPRSFVIEDELAASTINLKVFWINTIDYRVTSSVLRGLVIKEVKEALDLNGFNLPADITELKLYSTEDIPLKLRKDPRDLLGNLEGKFCSEKLQNQAIRCIFLNFYQKSKGCRCYPTPQRQLNKMPFLK